MRLILKQSLLSHKSKCLTWICLLVCIHSCSVFANSRVLQGFSGYSQTELDKNVWNFCDLQKNGAVSEIQVYDGAHTETLDGRCDYYLHQGDSLFWSGYNVGRRLGVLACDPILCENNKKMEIKAKGHIDVNTPITEDIFMQWNDSATGIAIIASGDTIRNVRLVKQEYLSFFKTGSTDESDSIKFTIYRWYGKNKLIPFAIQKNHELFIDNSIQVELNEEISDASRIIELIEGAEIYCKMNYIYIRFAREVAVSAYIMDLSGNLYSSTKEKGTSITLDISRLPSNKYILSIVSEETAAYTHKRFIRL